MKTPLEELIEQLNEESKNCGSNALRIAFDLSANLAKQLLPKEREGIEEAFNAGANDGATDIMNEGTIFGSSSDYFTKTYWK